MQRIIAKPHQSMAGFGNPSEAVERNDLFALKAILIRGFSGAQNYSDMSRNRYYPILCDGVSVERLSAFCSEHLSGSPIPDGRRVFGHGRTLLSMFQAAQEKGLVVLNHVQAERFLPETR